jgi:diguanylate cyclase
MPRRWPRSDLDLPSGKGLDELIEGAMEGILRRNGQTLPGTAEVTAREPRLAIPARAAQLQRLLGASIDERSQLAAQVRRLEAELRRKSTELAKLRTELRGAVHDALTDPLTGLANRRAFDRELAAVAAGAGRRSTVHLMIADIDRFKRINDAHGHDVGDEILCIVGQVLLANVRGDGLVARLGGDEFGLLLPGASPHYTAAIAKRLCALLASRPLLVRGFPEVSEQVTVSIGVAASHAGASSAEWYARADAALYQAKRGGRNRIAIDTASRPLPEPGSFAPLRSAEAALAPAGPRARITADTADAD